MPRITPPTILIADDHALMRDGMALMIHTAWAGSVCKVASDYLEVIKTLELQDVNNPFDAIILDLRMPGMRGVESVRLISQLAGKSPVIVCTALEDPNLVDRLMTSGIFSAVNKTAGADALLLQLNAALILSKGKKSEAELVEVGAEVSQSNGIDHRSRLSRQNGSSMLTSRQREILKLLHSGKPNKVLASQLGLGLGTIKSHLHTLYAVMGVTSRSEAIIKSHEWLL